MRDIILVGGSGTCPNPITLGTSKQLMPVYDKPMIYYPLSALMLVCIQDALIITTPHDTPGFHRLLGDGSQLGAGIAYTVQEVPNGLVQAFVLDTDHIGTDSVALVLDDNIFYGPDTGFQLRRHVDPDGGAVFAYHMLGPSAHGVVEFDENFIALSVEEKPAKPKSHYAVPGPYFYDNNVVDVTKNLKPSARGGYETTNVNRTYLKTGRLQVEVLPCGTAWLDTSTFDSLADATVFVCTIKAHQGMKVGVSEEVARRMGFIDNEGLRQRTKPLAKSGCG